MNTIGRNSFPLWRRLGCAGGILVAVNVPLIAATVSDNPDTSGFKSDSSPIDLSLGPFDFQPRADAMATYNNNILFTTNGALSDLVWDFKPGVQAVAGDKLFVLEHRETGDFSLGGDPLSITADSLATASPDAWPGGLLIIDESPQFEWFTRYSKNNYIGNIGAFNALLPKTKFVLGANFSYSDAPAVVVEARQRTGEQNIQATASGAYFISEKTSADTALTFSKLDYQQVGLIGYSQWSDATWLNYQWSELLNVGSGVNAGLVDGNNGFDQSFGQLSVRAGYRFAEKLNFSASAGGELRHYDSGLQDSWNPIFDLGANYLLSDRTSFALAGSRGVGSSLIGGSVFTITSFSFIASQGITDRVSTSLNTTYGIYDSDFASSNSAQTTSDYVSVQLSVNLQINHNWQGHVFYNYRTVLSDSTSTSVANDQVGIELTWKY